MWASKADLAGMSNRLGHVCMYRSIFGWYVVELWIRHNQILGSIHIARRRRFGHTDGAYKQYTEWRESIEKQDKPVGIC